MSLDSVKGYARVELSIDGEARKHFVSRLMLTAFVGSPPSPEHEAAHNDGNPRNNMLSNLRWATPTENAADKLSHGTDPAGEGNGNAKLKLSDVCCIRELAASGMARSGIALLYGVTPQNIKLIIERKIW